MQESADQLREHLQESMANFDPAQLREAATSIADISQASTRITLDPAPVVSLGRPRGTNTTANTSIRRDPSEFERVESQPRRVDAVDNLVTMLEHSELLYEFADWVSH